MMQPSENRVELLSEKPGRLASTTMAAERGLRNLPMMSDIGRLSAPRIGDAGVIEHIEELDPELGGKPLPELEVLEYREIQVLKAIVAEHVPAHRAKGAGRGRNNHRVAIHVAAPGG